MSNPKLISTPFASDGQKNEINEDTRVSPNNPTWKEGWDYTTSTPISEGGMPPTRLDFNGVLYAITDNIVHQTKGLGYEFDTNYASLIGGYPQGARVQLATGQMVRSIEPNNLINPNTDMTGWVLDAGAQTTAELLDVESGEYQSKINNETVKTVESVADLALVKNPKDGQVVFVKDEQGGDFIYKSALAQFNDGVVVYNGWGRVWDSLQVQPRWAGAKEGEDCTEALQRCLDFISPTTFDTSVAVMNNKESKIALAIPSTKLGYIISDTLWVGAGTKIIGTGKLSFKGVVTEQASKIITNFSDPLKPAISSSNWKTGGVRVAYDEKTTGEMYDQGLVSCTHDIELVDFNLFTQIGTRGYMGVRLQNSPRSIVNVSTFGFDYSIMLNACWTSDVDSFSRSHKCGLLADYDNNNCSLNGYYNADKSQAPLQAKNLIDFFTSDTDTDTTLNDLNKTFGFVSRYAYGSTSKTITTEGNHAGVVIANGDYNISSLYTEGNTDCALVTFAQNSNINIGLHIGAHDSYVYMIGANGKVTINAYQKDGTANSNIVKKLSQYNTLLSVPRVVNTYVRGMTYQNNEHVLYLGKTGNDGNNGLLDYLPLLTVNEALRRINDKRKVSDKNVIVGSDKYTICIVDAESYTLTGDYVLASDVTIKSLSSACTINVNGHVALENSNLSFINCNVVKSDVAGTVENAIAWTRFGQNSVTFSGGSLNILNGGVIYCDYNGSSEISLILNGVAVGGNANSQLIQSNYGDTSPHIVNAVRARGSISTEILGRSDKGVSVPALWQGKILI